MRPAFTALPLLAGCVTLFQLSTLPSPYWATLLLPVAAIAVRVSWLRLLFWFLLGLLWSALLSELRLSLVLPDEVEGKSVTITGQVVDLPQRRNNGSQRFLFQIETLQYQQQWIDFPARVRLSWYRGAQRINSGEQWQLTVRLKRPHGFSNPGGFDWEQWLFERGIRATGYLYGKEQKRLNTAAPSINRFRQQLGEQLLPHDETGILGALIIGDRQQISSLQWETLRNTGTSHLMAISGLHIGFIATLSFLLIRWFAARSTTLLLYLPAQQAGAMGAIAGALGYAAIAGFSLPTQRALIMVIVVMGMVLLRRQVTRWQGYFTALTAVLLFDPFSVLSAGFWLSFAAVGWILYALPEKVEQGQWMRWSMLLKLQLILLLGMLPLLLYLFQHGSLIAPIANLLMVPWIGMVVVPLALLSALLLYLSLPGGEWLMGLSSQLIEWSWPLLNWLEQLPAAHFSVTTPPLWMAVVGLIGVGVALYRPWPHWRWLALSTLLLPLLYQPPHPAADESWVTVLDVGQGLAVVVETRDRVLVYDTGDRFSSTFDAGSRVVAPFLQSRGWQKIDLVVVGHDDRDHIGGLAALRKMMPIAQIVTSAPDKIEGSQRCVRGQTWQWGSVEIDMIYPDTALLFGGNNGSCVVRIRANGEQMLLTGDIEATAERVLMDRWGASLQSDAIIVPHHGSRTSSIDTWVELVSPRWAVIPVGYRNRYRLPNKEVVSRYQDAGTQLWSSAEDGAVTLYLGSQRPPEAWRRIDSTLWRD